MRLRDVEKPMGLTVGGAALVYVGLLAVGAVCAFLTDVELLLIPATVFAVTYGAAWGTRQNRKLRELERRYEGHLRRKNGLD